MSKIRWGGVSHSCSGMEFGSVWQALTQAESKHMPDAAAIAVVGAGAGAGAGAAVTSTHDWPSLAEPAPPPWQHGLRTIVPIAVVQKHSEQQRTRNSIQEPEAPLPGVQVHPRSKRPWRRSELTWINTRTVYFFNCPLLHSKVKFYS